MNDETRPAPTDGGGPTLSEAGSAGTGTSVDSMVMPQWVRLQYLDPLTPYLSNSTLTDPKWFNAGDILPKFMALGVQNNVTYALPEYPETSMLFYRKDLFAKAGITHAPATYAEWAADAAKVTDKKHHIYGIGLIGQKGADQNVYRWTSIARAFRAALTRRRVLASSDSNQPRAVSWSCVPV